MMRMLLFVMFGPSGMSAVRLLVMQRSSRTERKEVLVMREPSAAFARWGRVSPNRLSVEAFQGGAFQPGILVVQEDPPVVRE